MADFNAVDALFFAFRVDTGHEAREGRQYVYPQTHRQRMLVRKLPREAPGHAGVAEIVDDLAEDVPACGHGEPPICLHRAIRIIRFCTA